jgi:hypothetical protein
MSFLNNGVYTCTLRQCDRIQGRWGIIFIETGTTQKGATETLTSGQRRGSDIIIILINIMLFSRLHSGS